MSNMAEKNAIRANPSASFLATAQRPTAEKGRIRLADNSFSETRVAAYPG